MTNSIAHVAQHTPLITHPPLRCQTAHSSRSPTDQQPSSHTPHIQLYATQHQPCTHTPARTRTPTAHGIRHCPAPRAAQQAANHLGHTNMEVTLEHSMLQRQVACAHMHSLLSTVPPPQQCAGLCLCMVRACAGWRCHLAQRTPSKLAANPIQ